MTPVLLWIAGLGLDYLHTKAAGVVLFFVYLKLDLFLPFICLSVNNHIIIKQIKSFTSTCIPVFLMSSPDVWDLILCGRKTHHEGQLKTPAGWTGIYNLFSQKQLLTDIKELKLNYPILSA